VTAHDPPISTLAKLDPVWEHAEVVNERSKSFGVDSGRSTRKATHIAFSRPGSKVKKHPTRDSRLDRLGNGSDLVDLEQESVTGTLLDGGLDPLGVGDGQVVSDNLDRGALGNVSPGLPVILVEGVL
jgi:hypothetical protein